MEQQKRDMIITQDTENTLLVGKLKVKRRDELKELRDELINREDINNYQISTQEGLASFKSILKTGYIREGNTLMNQYITSSTGDDCEYIKEKIQCTYLNSILLFTSLLGELDATNYNEIAQQFIGKGIIHCMPFENLWPKCSSTMVEQALESYKEKGQKSLNAWKRHDLKMFRLALTEGIISYDVVTKYDFSKIIGVGSCHFSKDMKELSINNTAILGDNSIFIKARKRK